MVADPNKDGQDMADENDDLHHGLTAPQERAIIALLNEQTVGRAADAAEVGQRTLYRWLKEPTFARAYREARREAFGQAIALTQRYAPLAVNTLAQVMMDDGAPSSSKVAAATTILRFGREGIELDDLAARIEALEETAPKREKSARWASYR